MNIIKLVKSTSILVCTAVLISACSEAPMDRFLNKLDDGKLDKECARGSLGSLSDDQLNSLADWYDNKEAKEAERKASGEPEPDGLAALDGLFEGLDEETTQKLMGTMKACSVE